MICLVPCMGSSTKCCFKGRCSYTVIIQHHAKIMHRAAAYKVAQAHAAKMPAFSQRWMLLARSVQLICTALSRLSANTLTLQAGSMQSSVCTLYMHKIPMQSTPHTRQGCATRKFRALASAAAWAAAASASDAAARAASRAWARSPTCALSCSRSSFSRVTCSLHCNTCNCE